MTFSENQIGRTMCIYPGRFQPFGMHHYLAYKHLCNEFGENNVFIATSNDTEQNKNPLTFVEKRRVIEQYGIKNIFEVASPYRPIEIMCNLPFNTCVVTAVGEKDTDRISKLVRKSDGYYTLYDKTDVLRPFREKGYVYIIPTQEIFWSGQPINGTLLRNLLPTASIDDFEDIMGWYNHDIHNLFKIKFGARQSFDLFEEFNSDQEDKHLKHPWECFDLSFNDLVELYEKSLLGALQNVTEKIDGQNLLVTFKRGQPLAARNKSEIKNPLTMQQMTLKFDPRSIQYKIFVTAFQEIARIFAQIPEDKLNEIFKNGELYLNLEVYIPEFRNVIYYGDDPFFVFHNLVSFNEFGKELIRYNPEVLYQLCKRTDTAFQVLPPRKIVLKSVYGVQTHLQEFKDKLSAIWKKYNLTNLSTIQDYINVNLSDQSLKSKDKPNKIKEILYPLEILFSQLGFTVLNEIDLILCKVKFTTTQEIRKRIALIQNEIHKSNDPKKIKKLHTELGKLNVIGGLDTILPIEGIVFTFGGKLMKLTGSFRFINQILGINRYSR